MTTSLAAAPGSKNMRGIRSICLVTRASLTMVVAALSVGCVQERAQHRAECLGNLRQIQSAVINLAYERGYYRGDIIPESEIAKVVGRARLICPSGGRYLIPVVGENPSCSVHGAPFAPGGEFFGPPTRLELGLRDRPAK